MAFATTQDVRELTGVSVNDEQIARGQAMVELYSNRGPDAFESLSTKDQRLIKRATAYQVAYMDAHPELFAQMDVAAQSQTDLSVSFRQDETAALIAPLARMALRGVSWRRSRSVRVKSTFEEEWASGNDDALAWRPL